MPNEPDNPKPGAAEIEAAVRRATERLEHVRDRGGVYLLDYATHDARVLLHLHATIATLTARAEAAEAERASQATELGKLRHWHKSDEKQRGRAEALAARVAKLEAVLTAIPSHVLADERGRDFCVPAGEWTTFRMRVAAALAPKEPS